jgi:carbonic anhydrase
VLLADCTGEPIGHGLARSNHEAGEGSMISAGEALERLRDGNRRFASDTRSGDNVVSRRAAQAGGGRAFAIILRCSDSRVPAGSCSTSVPSWTGFGRRKALLATELRHEPDALVRQAVRANIRVSANHLRHGSEVLEQLIQGDGLLVVGAEYSLETGLVDFFEAL